MRGTWLVIHEAISDAGDDVPGFERVGGSIQVGFADDDAVHRGAEFQEGAEGGVFQGLILVEKGGFTFVMARGDAGEEDVDLLAGDDVPDIIRANQAAERDTDHFVAGNGGTAAVARVDGGVYLDAQAADGEMVRGEFDTGDDTFGDGEAVAALRIAVSQDRILFGRDGFGTGERGMGVEEFIVVELEDGEVDVGVDGLDRGKNLVASLVGLDLDFVGKFDHVGVGENAVALDDDAAAGDVLGGRLAPRLVEIRQALGGEDFDDGVFDVRGTAVGGGGAGVILRAAGAAGKEQNSDHQPEGGATERHYIKAHKIVAASLIKAGPGAKQIGRAIPQRRCHVPCRLDSVMAAASVLG